MALRDQPYFPLYVQDYLTDEKLALCSLSTQGVYIRILCLLHKSETYGGILFKQIPKQNFSSNQYFAWVLSKQISVELENVKDALEELLFFEVLKIEQVDGVDFLYQKRMVKDNEISLARSKAGKKGGGNPNLFKQNHKQEDKQTSKQGVKQKGKQNPEYEYEYENEDKYEDNIILKEKKKKEKTDKLDLFISLVPDDWKPSIKMWLEYKKERKEIYKTEKSFLLFFEKIKKEAGGETKIFAESVEQSIKNNWAGVFPKKETEKMNNNPKQHNSVYFVNPDAYEKF